MFGFGSKSIVGLDVGSSSIKAVELKKGREGLEVAHLGVEPLAPDIVVDSMIVDSGTVSETLENPRSPYTERLMADAPRLGAPVGG